MTTFGLTKEHWNLLKELVLEPLHRHEAKLWVFGSRATKKSKPFSDIDILVEGKLPEYLLSKVRSEIEESNLPIKVDLVLRSDLADDYRDTVEKQKIKIVLD